MSSWPATTEANNFRQTYLKGFLDLSGGDINNRTGGLYIESDISSNSNVYSKNHVSIGTNATSFTANSIRTDGETLNFTVPLFLEKLYYFAPDRTNISGEIDIEDSETEQGKTIYVALPGFDSEVSPFEPPHYIFSNERDGAQIVSTTNNLKLYRGNTYTFVFTSTTSSFDFNISDNITANQQGVFENTTGMHVISTGSGTPVVGNYIYEYPLSVNGTANIKKNLLVERDLSLNGSLKMGSVVHQF